MHNETLERLAVVYCQLQATVRLEDKRPSVRKLSTRLVVKVARIKNNSKNLFMANRDLLSEPVSGEQCTHGSSRKIFVPGVHRVVYSGLELEVVLKVGSFLCLHLGECVGINYLCLSFRKLNMCGQSFLKSLLVQGKTALLSHQLSEIYRKTHSLKERESVLAGYFFLAFGLKPGDQLLELFHTAQECACKGLLLILNDLVDELLFLCDLGEHFGKVLYDNVDQLAERSLGHLEDILAITYSAAQDTAKYVATAFVTWVPSIGNRKGKGTDVVCHHTVGHIDITDIILASLSGVWMNVSDLFDVSENGGEDIRVIVGVLVLESGHEALESHASIHVASRKTLQRGVSLAVELHKHQVPDLHYVGVVHVDQVSCVAATNTIIVNLGTRSARSGVSHLPKVVGCVKGEDAFLWEVLFPNLLGLEVFGNVFVSLEVRSIKAIFVQSEYLGKESPRPVDDFLLKVVSETPVSKHFKKGVVIHVLSNIVQVVVLASCTDALLGVACTFQLAKLSVGICLSQEQGLVLRHARVDEQQRGVVVRHHGAALPVLVTALLHEKVHERRPHLVRRPLEPLHIVLHLHVLDFQTQSPSLATCRTQWHLTLQFRDAGVLQRELLL
mmetsp:Transcript_16638/g.30522  ORF Transcript_16638/g.30522 Transcript_16638/m.30522 type:complete len:613 (+) Transcript_16638:1354-3192(+)